VADESVWIGRRDVFFHRDLAEVVSEGLDLAQARLLESLSNFPAQLSGEDPLLRRIPGCRGLSP
jgi:hypothetical protein